MRPVDRIEILVVIDNVTDSLSSVPGFVTREWTVLRQKGMKLTAGASLCCANHGFSLLITAHRGASRHTMLFDGGPVDYAVERNGTRLGVDFAVVDAMMLSHGHWDHAGGLPQAIRMARAENGGRAVPLFLHPGMFFERGSRQPDGGVFPMQSVPTPTEWTEIGAEPIVTDQPVSVLEEMFFISDEIPRITEYERGLPGQVRRVAPDQPWEPDELLMDERFLAVHVAGKGIVVFSACSHAGIINVLTHAQRSFPGEKLHAVMGGLHLSGENEKIIPEAVRDIGGFGLELIIPAHCTGWRAVNALERAYTEQVVVPAAVGKRFSL